jgi:hypothetical protein
VSEAAEQAQTKQEVEKIAINPFLLPTAAIKTIYAIETMDTSMDAFHRWLSPYASTDAAQNPDLDAAYIIRLCPRQTTSIPQHNGGL